MSNKRAFNIKLVCSIFGILLLIESAFLFLSAGVSKYYDDAALNDFIFSGALTAFFGLLCRLLGRNHDKTMHKREAFFIVATTWILFSLFGLLPFYVSGFIPSYTDAFFETMSGFTTTGASILNDIEALPRGLLFWRSIIQWLGGMGIIVFTLALLPKLGIGGGVHLFNSEAPGLTHDKLTPRIDQTAKRLWGMYLAITAVLALLLSLGPMSVFDAVCHAFTAMATGGYSTKQASVAHWDSAYIEYVLSTFMFLAGTNFTLVYFFAKRKFERVYRDEEFRWYLFITLTSTLIIAAALYFTHRTPHIELSFRQALFQVISVMTTTGFATADYVVWGPFFSMFFIILMLLGGSAGSTAGGMKVVRVLVLMKNMVNEFRRQTHPNAIFSVRLNKQSVPYELVTKVLAFLFIYLLIILISTLVLTALGTSFEVSFGAVVTSISNVGPGMGESGPSGNFYHFHPLAKWFMSFIMLIGRLELFTVILLFTPSFWKK